MRNSIDITRKYQFGYMLLHHLTTVLIIIVFEAIAFWYFLDKTIGRQVVAVIFTIVYGLALYSYARKLAAWDNKPYTPLKPELKWGFLWGLAISASVGIFLIIYKLDWHFFAAIDENGVPYLTSLWAIGINMLFYIWTGPYFGFVESQGGGIAVYGQILMLVVPMIATTLGYKAGVKNFDLIEKLDSLTLEKNTEDDDE
ncbi:MAG: hypothetical protein ACI4TH_04545 [Candidatus Ornithomonoglobus sp.]